MNARATTTSRAILLLTAFAAAGVAFAADPTQTKHRGSYALNGRIHVGLFGHPDGKPITSGPAAQVCLRAVRYKVQPLRYSGWTKALALGLLVNCSFFPSHWSFSPGTRMAITPRSTISVNGPP